eukprot:TRINITY_DN15116_c0_g2_i1.p1 TRINITY_DN15116_c0_g2~~TRINITY_DN15116_c0_g2_i1.p1  ORF type:complete len:174 (-),score=26.08 TRINITY_DN15116_c0_g2_i1:141-608(-)
MATLPEPSNEILLEQLRDGTAKLELASSPTPLLLPSKSHGFYQSSFPDCTSHRFFARIGSSLGGSSSAMRKLEHYSVQKVTGDGRCLFRALVKGMAKNKGSALSPQQEKDDAGLDVGSDFEHFIQSSLNSNIATTPTAQYRIDPAKHCCTSSQTQ